MPPPRFLIKWYSNAGKEAEQGLCNIKGVVAQSGRFSKSSDVWLDRPCGNPFKDFSAARSLGIPRFDVQMSHEGEGGLAAESVRPSAKMKRNKGNRGNVATLRGKITHGGGAESNGVL